MDTKTERRFKEAMQAIDKLAAVLNHEQHTIAIQQLTSIQNRIVNMFLEISKGKD